MKKSVSAVLVVFVLLVMTGCGAFRNKLSKNLDALGAKDYRVTLYSGGVAVKTYEVTNTFINSQEGSDGWFFYYKGNLVRISGDVLIEEM
jgi:hypothetical protein